jgi:hypothetical protein
MWVKQFGSTDNIPQFFKDEINKIYRDLQEKEREEL